MGIMWRWKNSIYPWDWHFKKFLTKRFGCPEGCLLRFWVSKRCPDPALTKTVVLPLRNKPWDCVDSWASWGVLFKGVGVRKTPIRLLVKIMVSPLRNKPWDCWDSWGSWEVCPTSRHGCGRRPLTCAEGAAPGKIHNKTSSHQPHRISLIIIPFFHHCNQNAIGHDLEVTLRWPFLIFGFLWGLLSCSKRPWLRPLKGMTI